MKTPFAASSHALFYRFSIKRHLRGRSVQVAVAKRESRRNTESAVTNARFAPLHGQPVGPFLERDGYVARTVYPTSPPKVSYRLTPLGKSLRTAMSSVVRWADTHPPEVIEARKAYDKANT
jgi:hypothetical protein